MALGHGGGGHGGGHGGGWGGHGGRGGFTYLVDNSDWYAQDVDLQPAGNTVTVQCPSSNPFEDSCHISVETQRSGGISGPDARQVSHRILTRDKRLTPVHAGTAPVRQSVATAVRPGFLPGLGALPAGKPKRPPKIPRLPRVAPPAAPSWLATVIAGPVHAMQLTAPRPVRPPVKRGAKPKAAKPASMFGLGIDVAQPPDDGGGGGDASSAPQMGPPSYLASPPPADSSPFNVPFANSQYVPPPLQAPSAPAPLYNSPQYNATMAQAQNVPPPAAPAASSSPSFLSQLTSTVTPIAQSVLNARKTFRDLHGSKTAGAAMLPGAGRASGSMLPYLLGAGALAVVGFLVLRKPGTKA